MEEASSKTYFRVACEFQCRARKIDETELEVFRSVASRPVPSAGIRGEIDTLLRAADVGESMKSLIDRSISLLISIDQRLDRIEDDINMMITGHSDKIRAYEWVNADLGAEGFVGDLPGLESLQVSDYALVDIILPIMPEQRVVASVKLVEKSEEGSHFLFDSLHHEDTEHIFRYIRSREREILRSRKK